MLALKNPNPRTPPRITSTTLEQEVNPFPAQLLHALLFSASQLVFVRCYLQGNKMKVMKRQSE